MRPEAVFHPSTALRFSLGSRGVGVLLFRSGWPRCDPRLPRSAAIPVDAAGLSPVQSDWLEAAMPPLLPASARVAMVAGLDLVHGAQYQDIGVVDVASVVSVDDDHIIASLRGSLPALERMAAAADAESAESYSAGSVFSPVVLGDGGSEGSDAGDGDEW